MSVNDAPHETESNKVEIRRIAKDVENTAIAFFTATSDSLLLYKTVFFLALITDRAVAEITKNVTVLIPPAVPTGEPPINMSNIQMSVEGTVRDSCGTEAKPAVRVVTD